MNNTSNHIHIYTDGSYISAKQNSGVDAIGWSAVYLIDHLHHIAHGFEHTQRNLAKLTDQSNTKISGSARSEILAVQRSLKVLRKSINIKTKSTSIIIYTDSQFVIDSFTKLSVKKLPDKDRDLWRSLLLMKSTYQISFCKVKAHSGNILNNHADYLARNSARHGLSSKDKMLQLIDNSVVNYINNLLKDENMDNKNSNEIKDCDTGNKSENNDLVMISPFEFKSKHGAYSIVKVQDDNLNLLFSYYFVLFLANNTFVHTVLNMNNTEVYTDIESCYQVCIDHNNSLK